MRTILRNILIMYGCEWSGGPLGWRNGASQGPAAFFVSRSRLPVNLVSVRSDFSDLVNFGQNVLFRLTLFGVYPNPI